MFPGSGSGEYLPWRSGTLFGKLEKEEKDWTTLSEDERKAYIDESVEEAVTDYGNSVLYSSARNEYMIVRIKRMLERTVWALTRQLKPGTSARRPMRCAFGEERSTGSIPV